MNFVYKPEYLSPSSYMKIISQPYTYYCDTLMSLCDKEPQGFPAAVGSAFDYYIKDLLIKNVFKHKNDLLPKLKEGVEYPDKKKGEGSDERKLVWKTAFEVFRAYMSCGVMSGMRFHDVEIWETFLLEDLPLRVKLDASIIGTGGLPVPLDWKVKGFGSQASPTPGYRLLYDDGVSKGCHEKYSPSISMETISLQYATQLAVYGWKLREPFTSYIATIHEVSRTGKGKIRIAVIDGWITEGFQRQLYKDMLATWLSLENGEFLKKIRSKDNNLNYYLSTQENWY